jgi:CheY-like chemotaxis protein
MYAIDNKTEVLVIDDCPDDVFLLEFAASRCEPEMRFYPVKTAAVAKAYLAGVLQFSNRRLYPLPSIILLDLSLGGMQPCEFLGWLRAAPEFNALKVVVWTGSDDPRAITRVLTAGADRVVRKPSDREGLTKLIREMAREVEERESVRA